ncbi:MAG: rhodanese-like domain-containing protein [Phycisphaerales bacterium]
MTTKRYATRRGVIVPHLVRAMAIVGLAGLIGVGHSMMRDKPIRLVAQHGTNYLDQRDDNIAAQRDRLGDYDAGAIPGMTPEQLLDAPVIPGMITLGEAHELFEQGALFLDARSDSAFAEGHIEGAVWMPASEVLMRAEELFAFDPGMPVVIYCTGGTCDASHNVQRRLEQYGPDLGLVFTDIRILGLGYEEWKRAGLPTSEGMVGGDG